MEATEIVLKESKPNERGENTLFEAFLLNRHGEEVSRCSISIYDGDAPSSKTWRISSWYSWRTNNGFGTKCLGTLVEHMLAKLGEPESVEYVWNGKNKYVYEWMEKHFNPISKCPLVVQKYQAEDDWNSHAYLLDVKSFLDYFCKGTIDKLRVNLYDEVDDIIER